MKKTLILVRHSKAENRESSESDFNRALTPEGRSDSLRMATYLMKAGTSPDFIVTSSATRAYETAMIFADTFSKGEKSILSSRKLYYSSAKSILDQIVGLDESISCVILVGHNPGISDLTRGLSSGRSFFMENTQVSLLEFDIEQWYQIDDIKPNKFENYSLKNIE